MKKTNLILPLFVLIALSSCGKQGLTSEQKTTISDALAFIDSSSFSFHDETRSSMTTAYSRTGGTNDIRFENRVIYDREKNYAASFDIDSKGILTSIFSFLYLDDGGSYISLSLPTEGTLKKTVTKKDNLTAAIASLKKDWIEGAANTYIACLRALLDSSKESYFSYLDQHSVSDFASGSKAGAFSFKMNWKRNNLDSSGYGSRFTGSELVSFENYLPVSSVNTGTGEWITATTRESLTNDYTLKFFWGEATPFYPDFSAYNVA